MRALRELAGGLFIALITILTVMGGIFLAVSQGGGSTGQPTALAQATAPTSPEPTRPTPLPATPTGTPTRVLPSATPTATLRSTDTLEPTGTDTTAATETATPEPSLTPTITLCAPPSSWVPYVIRRGDTLFQLSLRFRVSTRMLQAANCLETTDIKFGQVLYVPFIPTTPPPDASPTLVSTSTPIPQALQIINISLAGVEHDSTRPNGAIAFVHISFTGGAAPYTFYDDNSPQPANPMHVLTECNGTLIHTARVESGDGQAATQTYYFSPIVCP